MEAPAPLGRSATSRSSSRSPARRGRTIPGGIEYSRWAAMPLPGPRRPRGRREPAVGSPGILRLPPGAGPADAVEWHVNFADPRLFVAYGSAPLRPGRDAGRRAPRARLARRRRSTPARPRAVTVEDGRRRPCWSRAPRAAAASPPTGTPPRAGPGASTATPSAAADPAVIRRATTRLDPPTVTNLIAIAAPSDGTGPYSRRRDRARPRHGLHRLPRRRAGVGPIARRRAARSSSTPASGAAAPSAATAS